MMTRTPSQQRQPRSQWILILAILIHIASSCIEAWGESITSDSSSTADSSTPLSSTPISPSTITAATTTGHILFLSLSLRGHIVPLTRLASELVERGYKVSFAVQEDGREYVVNKNSTSSTATTAGGMKFVSLGRLPYAKAERREKLKQICHENSFFRGFLSLLNDIYLPNAQPMYKTLHSIVAREKPSLIIMDVACLGGLDVAHQFNIPYIINHPTLPLRLEHEPHYLNTFVGHARSASTTSASGAAGTTNGASNVGFLERAFNYLYPRLLAVALTPSLMDLNRMRWAHELPLYHSPAHVLEGIPAGLSSATQQQHQWSEQDELQERQRRAHATLLPSSVLSSDSPSLQPPAHSICNPTHPGPDAIFINTGIGALDPAQPWPQNVILTGPLLPPGIHALGGGENAASSAGEETQTTDASVDESDVDTKHGTTNTTASVALSSSLSSATLLPASLQSWLDKSSKPILLVLFGAGTMSYLDAWQVKSLAAGLTDSRFRVLWALRTEGKLALGSNLPNSFRIKTNFPQLPVLAHKHVRLVLSPCGSATVHESLFFGKPLLCIPLFGDQLELAARVQELAVGIQMEKWHLEVSEISKQVLHLVRNTTYRTQAKKIAKILRASGGTKLAADTVERVLLQRKFNLLPQPEQLQCWHQVYQLDLLALILAGFILAMLLMRAVLIVISSGIAMIRGQSHVSSDSTSIDSSPPEQITWKQIRGPSTLWQFLLQQASHPQLNPALLNGDRLLSPMNGAFRKTSADSDSYRLRSDSVGSTGSNGSDDFTSNNPRSRSRTSS